MKSLALLLPLVQFTTAAPLESRQLSQQLAPSMKALSIENIEPTIKRAKVKSIRLKYGPYKIRAGNSTEQVGNGRSMDPQGTGYTNLLADFPKDITVLKTNSSMVYEDGSHADLSNGLYVHHIFSSDGVKANPNILQCPAGKQGVPIPTSIFVSTPESDENVGMAFTSEDGTYNSGYYVGKDDPISSVLDIVNYTNETKTVFIVDDVQYIEGKVPNVRETSQQIVNLGMCSGASVSIRPPAGQTKFVLKSEPMTFTMGGHILSMMGHVHDGGLNMVAEINGKVACDSKAIYGGSGSTLGGAMGGMGGMGGMKKARADPPSSSSWQTVSSMTACYDLEVQKNDTLTLQAFYDLDAHPARHHVMGEGDAEEMAIMTMYFAPNPQ